MLCTYWVGLKCPHRSRVLKTRFLHSENRIFKTRYLIKHTHNSGKGLIKIWIKLESYRLEFCWEKFNTHILQNFINIDTLSLTNLSPKNSASSLTLTYTLSLTNSHLPITLTSQCLSLSLTTLPLSLLFPLNKFISQVRVFWFDCHCSWVSVVYGCGLKSLTIYFVDS